MPASPSQLVRRFRVSPETACLAQKRSRRAGIALHELGNTRCTRSQRMECRSADLIRDTAKLVGSDPRRVAVAQLARDFDLGRQRPRTAQAPYTHLRHRLDR